MLKNILSVIKDFSVILYETIIGLLMFAIFLISALISILVPISIIYIAIMIYLNW